MLTVCRGKAPSPSGCVSVRSAGGNRSRCSSGSLTRLLGPVLPSLRRRKRSAPSPADRTNTAQARNSIWRLASFAPSPSASSTVYRSMTRTPCSGIGSFPDLVFESTPRRQGLRRPDPERRPVEARDRRTTRRPLARPGPARKPPASSRASRPVRRRFRTRPSPRRRWLSWPSATSASTSRCTASSTPSHTITWP